MAMNNVFSTMQMVMAKSTKGSMTIKFTISFSFIQYGWHSQIRKVLANLYQQGGHFLWDSSSSAGTKQNRVQASSLRLTNYKTVNFVKMATEVTQEKSWVKFVARLDIGKKFFKEKVVRLWERCPGRFGIPIPGGVQGITECGTQCSGLGDKVDIGHRLDPIFSEIFSNPRILGFWDFMILLSSMTFPLSLHNTCTKSPELQF